MHTVYTWYSNSWTIRPVQVKPKYACPKLHCTNFLYLPHRSTHYAICALLFPFRFQDDRPLSLQLVLTLFVSHYKLLRNHYFLDKGPLLFNTPIE
jgi:hypothetical protein